MSDPRAELRARLVAEAEAAIDEMLAGAVPPGKESLADIERSARTASQRLEQAIATELAGAGAAELQVWLGGIATDHRLAAGLVAAALTSSVAARRAYPFGVGVAAAALTSVQGGVGGEFVTDLGAVVEA